MYIIKCTFVWIDRLTEHKLLCIYREFIWMKGHVVPKMHAFNESRTISKACIMLSRNNIVLICKVLKCLLELFCWKVLWVQICMRLTFRRQWLSQYILFKKKKIYNVQARRLFARLVFVSRVDLSSLFN